MAKREPSAARDTVPVRNVLARLSLFEGEEPAVLDWVAAHSSLERAAPDTLLLGPRHPKDRVYIIVTGLVEIRIGHHGERIIATLGPDQCVGEMSVIENAPPSANVIARTECEVVAIEGVALRALLESSRVVPRNLLRMLARRVRKDNLILGHSLEQQAVSAQHARLDALTGLFNRRWLDENLPEQIAQHQARARPLTLLMLDIDRFKAFNDTFGHLSGDQVLIAAARTVQEHVRTADQAARFGGEEFVILLPETATAEAARIASRIRHAIRRARITSHEGAPLPGVTVSIGLAERLPDESAGSLLARADAALYQAKQEGRNRLVISHQGNGGSRAANIPRLRRERPRD